MIALYVDGLPANLEAAANDALTWLEWFVKQDRKDACRLSGDNRQKLHAAIANLQQYLPKVEPEFVDTPEVNHETPAAQP